TIRKSQVIFLLELQGWELQRRALELSLDWSERGICSAPAVARTITGVRSDERQRRLRDLLLTTGRCAATPPERSKLKDAEKSSGVVAAPFPSFSRRGGCASTRRSRSLAAQTGWLVISNKIRCAARACKEATRPFTNHPALGF